MLFPFPFGKGGRQKENPPDHRSYDPLKRLIRLIPVFPLADRDQEGLCSAVGIGGSSGRFEIAGVLGVVALFPYVLTLEGEMLKQQPLHHALDWRLRFVRIVC